MGHERYGFRIFTRPTVRFMGQQRVAEHLVALRGVSPRPAQFSLVAGPTFAGIDGGREDFGLLPPSPPEICTWQPGPVHSMALGPAPLLRRVRCHGQERRWPPTPTASVDDK